MLKSLTNCVFAESREVRIIRRATLAEFLFCRAFGWLQAGNSNANLDAVDSDGTRYQIKGRRLTRHNGSRQLSAIRNLDGDHFDFPRRRIVRRSLPCHAGPRALIAQRATFVDRTNSHKFFLRDDVWGLRGVRDVTGELRAVDFKDARTT